MARKFNGGFGYHYEQAVIARTHTAIENMAWVIRDLMEVRKGQPAKYPVP